MKTPAALRQGCSGIRKTMNDIVSATPYFCYVYKFSARLCNQTAKFFFQQTQQKQK